MIRQRLCDSLYAAGRTKDAGESLLRMLNTFDEDVYMSEHLTKWVSGKLILHPFGLPAFETSLQSSFNNVSRLPKVSVTRPRTQSSTMKSRHRLQPSIRGLPHRY